MVNGVSDEWYGEPGEQGTPVNKSIAVFCSSSDAIDKSYVIAAEELGEAIAKRGCDLVYGGGNVGLMGKLAKKVQEHGGKVTGVIPRAIEHVAYRGADELICSKDLRERKAIMEERSDAFISLPGGFGTLEETMEILTLKQLNFHTKPIVLLNTNGFYDKLFDLFERIYSDSFTRESYREYYYSTSNPDEAMTYIDNYQPPTQKNKWY